MHLALIPKCSMYLYPMYSNDLIKGTLRTIILKLLSENTKMYGYEITQKVKELTDDEIQLTEGALYPMLHKLEAEGTVVTEQINIGKRVRKYYQLTDQGKEEAKEKVNEFLRFIDTMKDVLNHKNSFQPWLS
jgi:PadR family transcriptional regulator, regulatory protein PadR